MKAHKSEKIHLSILDNAPYILIFIIVIFFIFISKNNDTKLNEKELYDIHIRILNHKFIPNIIHAPTKRILKLHITNEDSTPEEFESYDLKREKIVLPLQTIKIILAPLKNGEYEFFGDFHQDTAQGRLIIEDEEV